MIYVVHQHGAVAQRRPPRGLRVLALPVPRRQAPVLLAADQPHGAAGGVPAAVLPALLGVGLFDTHLAVALAHCLFNVPLAVWILEGFMSGVPREIDETAYHRRLLVPALLRQDLPAADRRGIGVTAFFCFMFCWVELLLARTLTSVNAKPIAATMTRTVSAAGHGLGPARRRRRADHRAGRARDLVRPQLHRQGLRPGEGVRRRRWTSPGWPGRWRPRCSSRPSALRCSRDDGAGSALAARRPSASACSDRDDARRPRCSLALARRRLHPPRLARPRSAPTARHAAARRWHRLSACRLAIAFAGRCRGRVRRSSRLRRAEPGQPDRIAVCDTNGGSHETHDSDVRLIARRAHRRVAMPGAIAARPGRHGRGEEVDRQEFQPSTLTRAEQ